MKAFPQTLSTIPAASQEPLETYQGMDLLDYFAAKAMAALISDPNLDVEMSRLADISYQYANAMMKERTK
jgi:hypothetical protein